MKKVGVILIISGLLIASIPFIGNSYMESKRNQLYLTYLKEVEQGAFLKHSEDLRQSGEDKTLESRGSVQAADDKRQEEEATYSFSENDVIGKIKIPHIKVDLLILEGESKTNLKLGAAHMLDTAYPGEKGNCVIAGHRNYTFGSMFNRLGEVQLQDIISIEIGKKEYSYQVDEIEIINPEDLSVLEQPKEEKRVTLLTCHPIHVGNKRLLIKGKLIADRRL